MFARNRGAVWAAVRHCTGWGETRLEPYRDRILGLEAPLPKSWGFDEPVRPLETETKAETVTGTGAERQRKTETE